MKGLEPPRLSAPDPKSGAATNYATSARGCKDTTFCIGINNALKNRSTRRVINQLILQNMTENAFRKEITGKPAGNRYP